MFSRKPIISLLLLSIGLNGCHTPQGSADSSNVRNGEVKSREAPEDVGIIPDQWESVKHRSQKQMSEVNKVFFVDDLYGWAVGWQGTIFHTTDMGETWSSQKSGSRLRLRDVWFANRDVGWAIGGDIIEHNTTNRKIHNIFLYTEDGGVHWQKRELPVPNIRWKLNFVDSNNGWLVGWGNDLYRQPLVARTRNGGGSWDVYNVSRELSLADPVTIRATSFVSHDEGWAIGDSIIYHSLDGGVTWEVKHVKPFDPKRGYIFEWIQFLDARTGWVGGKMAGHSGNITSITRTTDGGETWEESIPPYMFNKFHFLNSKVGIGVGYSFLSPHVNETHFDLPKYDGVVVLTTDGGITWKEIYRVSKENFYEVVFSENGTGWILGERGTILCHKL